MGWFSQKGLCYSFEILHGLLSHKNIRISRKNKTNKNKMGKFGEIDSADTCAGKFPLVPMGGWAEGPACADTGARTPIGASGNIKCLTNIFTNQTLLKLASYWLIKQVWFGDVLGRHLINCLSCPLFKNKSKNKPRLSCAKLRLSCACWLGWLELC